VSKALLGKLLRSRESTVTIGERTFTIRRPTDADAIGMQGHRTLDFINTFVIGWDLAESEFDPGGTSEKVPFDSELLAAWIADHPELWEPLALPIVDAYTQHVNRREEARKN
jgi:hypothetical protein